MLRFSAFLLEQIEAEIAWVCLSSIRPRTAFSTGQNKRWPWFTFYALRVGEEGVVCTPHQRPTLILWHTCGQKYSLILILFPFILVYLFLSFYSRIRLHSFKLCMFSLFFSAILDFISIHCFCCSLSEIAMNLFLSSSELLSLVKSRNIFLYCNGA